METCLKCGRCDETVALYWHGRPRCPHCFVGECRAERRGRLWWTLAAAAAVAATGRWLFALGLLVGAATIAAMNGLVLAGLVMALRWRRVAVSVGKGRPLCRIGRVTFRRRLHEGQVRYVPRTAIRRAAHVTVVAASRLLVLASGVLLVVTGASDQTAGAGAGTTFVVLSLLWLPAAVRSATEVTAEDVAAARAAEDVLAGRLAAGAAVAAYPRSADVAEARASLLLEEGDVAGAAAAVRDAWRDETQNANERSYAAATYAWALALLPAFDRDEAWAAATYATRTWQHAEALTAFAGVLRASGYRTEAAVLAAEIARHTADDVWYARARSVAAGG